MAQEFILFILLAFCSYTDVKYRKVFPGAALAALGLVLMARLFSETGWPEIGAGALPGLAFLALAFLSRQALGYGDALLILICGVALGWERCVSVAAAAFFWAGIWGLILWRFRNANRKKEFAFVPFLLAGLILQKAGELYCG